MLNPDADELDSDAEADGTGDASGTTVEIGSDDFWEVLVDLGGDDGEITIDKLADGYLRQADYTRKTQELAELRREAEEAVGFHKTFTEDPKGFISALAAQAGLIDEGDMPPGELPGFMQFPTAEKLAAMIEQRARELNEEDPRMQEYVMIQARDTVNGAFDGYEKQYEMSIPPELRQSILEEAIDNGAGDLKSLELVFRARLAEAQAKTSRTQQTRRTAPSRPGVSGAPVSNEPTLEVNSIEDAFALAQAQLMGR
jgi:hypothetical protein